MLDDRIKRGMPGVAMAGLSLSAGILFSPTLAYIVMGFSIALLVVYYGGGLLGQVAEPRFPWSRPKMSRVKKHGVVISVAYHWDDEPLGKPMVVVDNETRSIIQSIWAMLDVEVRNTTHHPVRVRDLYMEIREEGLLHKRLVGIAEPAAIGANREWAKGNKNPKRVEWLLEPHSAGLRQNIDFEHWWKPGTGPMIKGNKFEAAIVAELEGGPRKVRLYLQEDIWGKEVKK